MADNVLGIDLGTSTTVVSIIKDEIPTIIPVPGQSIPLIPSVVYFDAEKNDIITGVDAKNKRAESPDNTIFSVKRLIGRKYSHKDTAIAKLRLPYKISEGVNDSIIIDVNNNHYSPQEISSQILKEARRLAEEFLGETVDKAVITVPANFNEAQRRATQKAGTLAGLDVLRIVNEPTAAALAYGFGNHVDSKIAVYDFGGGTFDMTILAVTDNFFEVLSTDGDSFLGGDDLDNALLSYMINDIEKKYKISMVDYPQIPIALASESERIKIGLTDREYQKIIIRNIIPVKDGWGDYSFEINRDVFENVINPIIDRTFDICKKTFKKAHLKPDEIDEIILVGGSTKVPYVQKKVALFFKKEPCVGIQTDFVVSMGAAILARSLVEDFNEESPVLLDVTPLALGVGTVGDMVEILVDKNEPLPVERHSIFTNAFSNQKKVKVQIYQGESNLKSESLLMGEILLDDLPAMARGELKISVQFELDTNGVLQVSAHNKDTGKSQKIALNILGLEENTSEDNPQDGMIEKM